MIEVLLDSSVTSLVISSFNKEGPVENTIKAFITKDIRKGQK